MIRALKKLGHEDSQKFQTSLHYTASARITGVQQYEFLSKANTRTKVITTFFKKMQKEAGCGNTCLKSQHLGDGDRQISEFQGQSGPQSWFQDSHSYTGKPSLGCGGAAGLHCASFPIHWISFSKVLKALVA